MSVRRPRFYIMFFRIIAFVLALVYGPRLFVVMDAVMELPSSAGDLTILSVAYYLTIMLTEGMAVVLAVVLIGGGAEYVYRQILAALGVLGRDEASWRAIIEFTERQNETKTGSR